MMFLKAFVLSALECTHAFVYTASLYHCQLTGIICFLQTFLGREIATMQRMAVNHLDAIARFTKSTFVPILVEVVVSHQIILMGKQVGK